jgi:hypothetical protein
LVIPATLWSFVLKINLASVRTKNMLPQDLYIVKSEFWTNLLSAVLEINLAIVRIKDNLLQDFCVVKCEFWAKLDLDKLAKIAYNQSWLKYVQ